MSDLLERLHKLQVDADTRHLPTELTYECRMAISGKGPRAFDWSDKPHRLVYDLSREVERLTAERDADRDSHQREAIRAMEERDAALAKVTQYEQAFGTLHGDSLDAIMEVIGEGEQFAWYNKGKAAMRDWFLRRISAMLAAKEGQP